MKSKCDFCSKTRELVPGPYDNLICNECVIEFSKEERKRDKGGDSSEVEGS